MVFNRNLIWVVLICLGLVLSACGEKANNLSPEESWKKFMDALAENNVLAISAMANKQLTSKINRANPMDYANLIVAHETSNYVGFEVVAQDKESLRAKVTYKSSEMAEYGQEFIVLFTRPGKNWKVDKIEGDVKITLPGFEDM